MRKQPNHPAGEPPDQPEDERSTGETPAEPELDVADLQTVLLTSPRDLRDNRATQLTHHRWWADNLRGQQVGLQREIADLQEELETMSSEQERGDRMHLIAALWRKWTKIDVRRRAHLAAIRWLNSETDRDPPG